MITALFFTTLAGLSTGLGGLVVLGCRRPGERLMACSLGFAAGVMVTVSLSDMLPHTIAAYSERMPPPLAALAAMSLCLMGMFIALLLGKCIPNEVEAASKTYAIHPTALHSAMVTTAAIVLHNLPEGVLTLFTGFDGSVFGASLIFAVALHNIPEGIAIAVPVYYATGSRARGVIYALLSGLAEPIGALAAFFFFRNYISPAFLDGLVSTIAGIMLFVSVSELLPEAFSYRKRAFAVWGMCGGIVVMSVGIYLV